MYFNCRELVGEERICEFEKAICEIKWDIYIYYRPLANKEVREKFNTKN